MPSTVCEFGGHGLGFFDRDDAVLADLLHGLGNHVADGRIAVGGDAANLSDHVARNRARELADFFDGHFDGLIDAALDRHRVGARGNGFHAFAEDGLREDGRGGGAVAGNVRSLGGNFAQHLRAHIFQRILEFDLFGDGDAVLSNGRAAEFFLEHHVAAARAERDLYGIGQLIDAAQDCLAGIVTINDLFCHLNNFLVCLTARQAALVAFSAVATKIPRTSSSRMMMYSLPSSLISLPEYLPNRMRSPGLHVECDERAVFQPLAVAGGEDFAFLRLLLGGIGNDDAVACGFLFRRSASPRCGRIRVGCS